MDVGYIQNYHNSNECLKVVPNLFSKQSHTRFGKKEICGQ